MVFYCLHFVFLFGGSFFYIINFEDFAQIRWKEGMIMPLMQFLEVEPDLESKTFIAPQDAFVMKAEKENNLSLFVTCRNGGEVQIYAFELRKFSKGCRDPLTIQTPYGSQSVLVSSKEESHDETILVYWPVNNHE